MANSGPKEGDRVSQKVIDQKHGLFRRYIARKKLKSSRRREEIARVFFGIKGHVNLDQLYRYTALINPRIGYTTVYRTLKLLAECGLAAEIKFADGHTRYENVDQEGHHDHLICSFCGSIVEFRDEDIERIQQEIAVRYHFSIKDHRLEIYGECPECRKDGESGEATGDKKVSHAGSNKKNNIDR